MGLCSYFGIFPEGARPGGGEPRGIACLRRVMGVVLGLSLAVGTKVRIAVINSIGISTAIFLLFFFHFFFFFYLDLDSIYHHDSGDFVAELNRSW